MKTIIANWKSHKNNAQIQQWMAEYQQALKTTKLSPEVMVAIAPPMSAVAVVSYLLGANAIPQTELAVQDLSPFPPGSYTGAVSTGNLEGLNVKLAILGHSERRRYFHETHQEIANKVDLAWQARIQPLVCIDQEYFAQQLAAIPEENWSKLWIAYEPVASIGTGNEAPVADVKKVVDEIKSKYHPAAVVYGGSVASDMIAEYLTIVDGALVATHSLEVPDFMSLLSKVK